MLLEVGLDHSPSVIRVNQLVVEFDVSCLLQLLLWSWWLLFTSMQEILLAVVHFFEFLFFLLQIL